MRLETAREIRSTATREPAACADADAAQVGNCDDGNGATAGLAVAGIAMAWMRAFISDSKVAT